MNALWLILIVPLCFMAGGILFALLSAADDSDADLYKRQYQEIRDWHPDHILPRLGDMFERHDREHEEAGYA